jgi:hypothetical protein
MRSLPVRPRAKARWSGSGGSRFLTIPDLGRSSRHQASSADDPFLHRRRCLPGASNHLPARNSAREAQSGFEKDPTRATDISAAIPRDRIIGGGCDG